MLKPTARLVVDALRPDDAEALFHYRADPVVARYQGWGPASIREAREFIDAQQALTPDMLGCWVQRVIACTLQLIHAISPAWPCCVAWACARKRTIARVCGCTMNGLTTSCLPCWVANGVRHRRLPHPTDLPARARVKLWH